MDLMRFIKLFYKNLGYLIVIPVLMAILAWHLTKNLPREYESTGVIFTGITSGYSIESVGGARFDFNMANAQYDNMMNILKSRTTLEETGLRLFVQNIMLEAPNHYYLNKKNYDELQLITPPDVKRLIVKGDPARTYSRMKDYMNQNDSNFLYNLIHLYHRHYSYNALLNVAVKRIKSSDLVELYYKNDDPGIVTQTLKILIDAFTRQYKGIKLSQSHDVVAYFERQLKISEDKLSASEDKLLQFNKANRIINYNEQTKFIADHKEKFEMLKRDVEMEHAGAKNVVKRLEEKLGTRFKIIQKNKEILSRRAELANVLEKISTLTVYTAEDTLDQFAMADLEQLYIEKSRISTMLSRSVDSLTSYEKTIEGYAVKDLVNDWLEALIMFEDTKAKLEVLRKKEREFIRLYSQFAPLGAILKRIEREIDVTEREYLEILHNLGMAKLKQQNNELSTSLSTSDAPSFNANALPNKRIFFIIVAFIAGFVLTALAILIIEFLDSRIKSPSRAKKFIGLPVAGYYPILKGRKKDINYDKLTEACTNEMMNYILEQKLKKKPDSPLIMLFFSVNEQEGRTLFIRNLIDSLNEINKTTILLSHRQDLDIDNTILHKSHIYDSSDMLYRTNPLTKYFNNLEFSTNHVDFIIFEIPALTQSVYPAVLMNESDENFLVVAAYRVWKASDKHVMDRAYEVSNNSSEKFSTILNYAKPANLEEVLGELPRKRSYIRKAVKKFITRYLVV